jgi:ClpP class serine protease
MKFDLFFILLPRLKKNKQTNKQQTNKQKQQQKNPTKNNKIFRVRVSGVMVFNDIFNNISVIS